MCSTEGQLNETGGNVPLVSPIQTLLLLHSPILLLTPLLHPNPLYTFSNFPIPIFSYSPISKDIIYNLGAAAGDGIRRIYEDHSGVR